MLEVSWFEFIVRGIPEGFIFVLAVHAFSKTGINLKKYLLSVMIYCTIVLLVRFLPIEYGINSILSLILLIVLVSYISKIDIIKSIRSGIIIFILGFIFEGLNVSFIQFVLKKDLNIVFSTPISKTLYGLPSVIVLGIVVIIYYSRLSKRNELRYI